MLPSAVVDAIQEYEKCTREEAQKIFDDIWNKYKEEVKKIEQEKSDG